MDNANIVASIAAFLTAIGYLPQAIKTIKSRDTNSISFWMYFCSLVGVIFWLIFGLMIENYPIIFKNVVIIILSGIILYIKTCHILSGKDDKQSFRKFKDKVRKIFNIFN